MENPRNRGRKGRKGRFPGWGTDGTVPFSENHSVSDACQSKAWKAMGSLQFCFHPRNVQSFLGSVSPGLVLSRKQQLATSPGRMEPSTSGG